MDASSHDRGETASVAYVGEPSSSRVERPTVDAQAWQRGQSPALLRAALTLQEELTRLALDGASLDHLTHNLAARLGNPVLVENRFGRVLSVASPIHEPLDCPIPSLLALRSPALRPEAALLFSGRAPLRLPASAIAHQSPARIIAPIVIHKGTVAYLSLVEQHHPADDEEGELAWRASLAFATVFARLSAALEVETRFRADLLDTLVFADDLDDARTVARAALLDYDLLAPQSLLLLDLDLVRDAPLSQAPSDADLVTLLMPWARGTGRGGIVVAKDGLVAVLLAGATSPDRSPTGSRPLVRNTPPRLDRSTARLVDTMRREIASRYPDAVVTIVAAPPERDWHQLRASYAVARKAIQFLRLIGERGTTVSITDSRLALFFLLDGTSPHVVSEFVERILGTLRDYDAQHGRSLIATLETYLREDGNLESTARHLNIHTSTLKYRLARIADLGGFDLRNSDHRFNAALALRLRALSQPGPFE